MYPTQDPVPDLPPQRWAFPVELHLCTLYLSSFRLITVYIPAFSTRGCQLFDRERPCFNDLCIPGAGPVPGLKGSMVNILFANTLKLTNASFTWWRRKWQPTPILLPGKAHGPRSLVGDNPWGRKESDRTEPLRFTHFILYHWRRKWQPTPVFLLGESHGPGSLAGCGLWGPESDTTEVTEQERVSVVEALQLLLQINSGPLGCRPLLSPDLYLDPFTSTLFTYYFEVSPNKNCMSACNHYMLNH